MAIHVLKRVSELGEDLVLAPERFDPRRQITVRGHHRLADYVDVLTENASASSLMTESRVLVLDTTHAYEGFVIFRHDLVRPSEVGSSKRWLQPGDVIVSRLRPYLRQVALVDEALFRLAPGGNPVVASTEFFVLRARDGEMPAAAFVPFLLSDAVQAAFAAGQEGGHHPRFPRELLEGLPVADSVVADGQETVRAVTELASNVRAALMQSRALVATVDASLA
jgi:hypothetical protein